MDVHALLPAPTEQRNKALLADPDSFVRGFFAGVGLVGLRQAGAYAALSSGRVGLRSTADR